MARPNTVMGNPGRSLAVDAANFICLPILTILFSPVLLGCFANDRR
jgi:hypothetical protein